MNTTVYMLINFKILIHFWWNINDWHETASENMTENDEDEVRSSYGCIFAIQLMKAKR